MDRISVIRGCFLLRKKQADESMIYLIPRSAALWMLCSLVTVIIVSFILHRLCSCEAVFGYSISAVSFISSFVTAKIVLSHLTEGVFVKALTVSAVIIISALLAGFLIDSSGIDISGILSLSTFSFAGIFSGCVFGPVKKKKTWRIKAST